MARSQRFRRLPWTVFGVQNVCICLFTSKSHVKSRQNKQKLTVDLPDHITNMNPAAPVFRFSRGPLLWVYDPEEGSRPPRYGEYVDRAGLGLRVWWSGPEQAFLFGGVSRQQQREQYPWPRFSGIGADRRPAATTTTMTTTMRGLLAAQWARP